MRLIKFRAWDKKIKRFGFPQYVPIPKITQYPDGIFSLDGYSEYTLSQFTGLLDKNGKEIYEGDVVKWSDGNYKHPHNPRIAVVEFNPDIQFVTLWATIFHYGAFAYKDTDKHFEVIGNIYENSELLKNE